MNRISRVAVVGASGNCGSHITNSLLNTGKHAVTAISRFDSKSTFPQGVTIKQVDYSKPDTLVEALREQDALVVTLSGFAPKETQDKLAQAAGEAGVKWILPNEWASDTANEKLVKDMPPYGTKVSTRKLIEDVGKSSYIAMVTGYWYEMGMAGFGFDIATRKVTLFDDGETKVSLSTLPQIGRAVAALLSLPVQPEGSEGPCLEQLRNQVVYIDSFTISQKELLASTLRVSGSSESDWSVSQEPARERFAAGMKQVQQGKKEGFRKFAARVFFDDGVGNFEKSRGTLNGMLGLPQEDLDDATRIAMKRMGVAAQR